MKKVISEFSLIVLLVLSLLGCLDDRIAPELNLQTESAIELLVYLESNGDYINSSEIDDFVSAEEVYANRNSFLIVDVRLSSDFIGGHIENALNVQPKDLLGFIRSHDLNNYAKVVVVSESGQSAAYYTALLKFAGIPKVYSMEYGMAAWHNDFVSIWLGARRNFRVGSDEPNYFTNEDYPKSSLTNLPKLSFQSGTKDVKEKIEERIIILLSAGFDEKLDNSDTTAKPNQSIFNDGNASIAVGNIYSSYDRGTNLFSGYYVMCFGSIFLYNAKRFEGPFASQGHLPSAVHYLPMIDIRSTNDLQTIPTNKMAAVYDINGQVSAKIVAYLRLLGYDAKSVLFGANTLFYSRVLWEQSLAPFAFMQEMVKNLPYVTGQ